MARRGKRAKTKKKQGFSSFTAFAMGLIVGAASTALYIGVVRDQPMNIGAGINKILESRQADSTQGASESAVSGSEIAAVKNGEYRYDFYEILIEDRDKFVLQNQQTAEPATPSSSTASQTTTATTPPPSTTEPTTAAVKSSGTAYVLQVGSYQVYDDADKLKAQLALSGIISFIQKATVDGRDYFRVRTGPYENVQNMNKVSQTLANLGYTPLRYKLSPRG